jgi:hypothetical protein
MILSDIQTRVLRTICKNNVFHYSGHIKRFSPHAEWVSKDGQDRVTDSTMRRLRNMGLVKFTRTEFLMTATPTKEGREIDKKG